MLVFVLCCSVAHRFDGDFPGGSVVKNLPANAGDTAWIPELRTSPGGHVNPL